MLQLPLQPRDRLKTLKYQIPGASKNLNGEEAQLLPAPAGALNRLPHQHQHNPTSPPADGVCQHRHRLQHPCRHQNRLKPIQTNLQAAGAFRHPHQHQCLHLHPHRYQLLLQPRILPQAVGVCPHRYQLLLRNQAPLLVALLSHRTVRLQRADGAPNQRLPILGELWAVAKLPLLPKPPVGKAGNCKVNRWKPGLLKLSSLAEKD